MVLMLTVVLLFLLGLVQGEYIIYIFYNFIDLVTVFDAIYGQTKRSEIIVVVWEFDGK